MVNDIFETFITLEHGIEVADVLSIYGNLFEKLHIHIDDYEDDFTYVSFDDEDDLQNIFKKILLKEAQNNGIIPENWDIEERFELDGDFAIINNDPEDRDDIKDIQDIVVDFKDWTGIELDIID